MKKIIFKQRWKLGILMSFGIVINYIDRVNISHAIIPIANEFHLTYIEQGIILSAFSWGYVLFMPFGGVMVDKIGSKKASTISVASWSIATLWSGLATGYNTLLMSRIAVGMGEAPIFPANAKIVRENFPLEERGRATALFDAGSYIGTALSAPLVVYIIMVYGWRESFIASAVLGLIWIIVWKYNTNKLMKNLYKDDSAIKISFPVFIELLKNKKILGASFGFFCYNYAKSFFLTWFPTYLVVERGFDFISVGIFGMIPAVFAIFGEALAGIYTDKMIKNGYSVTFARKLPIVIGLIFSSIICLTEFVDSEIMIILLLSLSFAATISASPGIWAIPGDIAPSSNLVGTIGGIQNTFSNIAGIVAPIITGIIISETGTFTPALILTSILAILGSLSYWFIVGELSPLKIKVDKNEK